MKSSTDRTRLLQYAIAVVWMSRIVRNFLWEAFWTLWAASGLMYLLNSVSITIIWWNIWHASAFTRSLGHWLYLAAGVCLILAAGTACNIAITRRSFWEETKVENIDIGFSLTHMVEMQEEPILSSRYPYKDWV